MDLDELRQIIESFSFNNFKQGSQGFDRVLIQLFGLLGNGKSSFINTCKYVWTDGEYQNWAKAKECDEGHTVLRIPYQLTDNIFLVDNRGFSKMDSYEAGEIYAQLGNLLPLGKMVEWTPGFGLTERIVKAEKLVKSSDFIIPVYVHSVKHTIPDQEIKEVKALLHTARNLTGIYPIVALTHRTFGNLCAVEATFRDMGVERIFAFENYTNKDHFKTRGRHEEVLRFLREVIRDVQFRVEHAKRDPEKELCERKQFVLNYVNQQGKKKQQQEIERKKAMEQAMKMKEFHEQQEATERENQRLKKAYDEEERKKKERLEKQRSEEQEERKNEIKAQEEAKAKRRSVFNLFKKKSKENKD